MVNVDRWQVLDFVLREAEPDAVADTYHRADRDRDRLMAPEVALLEQKVRHVVIGAIDHQPLDVPDRPIRGMYVLATAHLDLTQRHMVINGFVGTGGGPMVPTLPIRRPVP